MSGISAINSYSYADYGNYASGKKVQSAADGAAELTIIQKEDTQARGYKVGENNVLSAKDMLNVADGAMSGITDYLQRIRELAVQASNTAVVTDGDRVNIQAEIDQMKQGITDLAKNTTFNTKNLLDGSNDKLQIATDANGSDKQIGLPNALLDELGITDFDVTKAFNLEDIDNALAKINAGRSNVGAQTNSLGHIYNYDTNTRLNTIGAQSRLEDLDIPKAISDTKKKEVLQEYKLFMQQRIWQLEGIRVKNLMFT